MHNGGWHDFNAAGALQDGQVKSIDVAPHRPSALERVLTNQCWNQHDRQQFAQQIVKRRRCR